MKEVAAYFQKTFKIPVVLDVRALDDIGIDPSHPVTNQAPPASGSARTAHTGAGRSAWSRVYIKAIPGRLIVRQTERVHARIELLLRKLGVEYHRS